MAAASASAVPSVNIMDKTNATDLSSGVFAILITVTWTKNTKPNPLPFHKFHQKLASSDITKGAPNCSASIAADSIADTNSFITHVIL